MATYSNNTTISYNTRVISQAAVNTATGSTGSLIGIGSGQWYILAGSLTFSGTHTGIGFCTAMASLQISIDAGATWTHVFSASLGTDSAAAASNIINTVKDGRVSNSFVLHLPGDSLLRLSSSYANNISSYQCLFHGVATVFINSP